MAKAAFFCAALLLACGCSESNSSDPALRTLDELCAQTTVPTGHPHPDCVDASCGAPCETSAEEAAFVCDGGGRCIATRSEKGEDTAAVQRIEEVCSRPLGGSGDGPVTADQQDSSCKGSPCGTLCHDEERPNTTLFCDNRHLCEGTL